MGKSNTKGSELPNDWGGIGVDYSILRPSGKPLSRTGGLSSGPIPLMQMINEVGRG